MEKMPKQPNEGFDVFVDQHGVVHRAETQQEAAEMHQQELEDA